MSLLAIFYPYNSYEMSEKFYILNCVQWNIKEKTEIVPPDFIYGFLTDDTIHEAMK